MRYFLELSYNGSTFAGWQEQPGAKTVQGEIQQAFNRCFGYPVQVTGAGRTDTGVHARGMTAHFDYPGEELVGEALFFELGKHLDHYIRLNRLYPVSDEAHARFSALSRTYRYYIICEKDPFMRATTWTIRHKLNLDAMRSSCDFLPGTRDFRSFSRSGSGTESYDCTINVAGIREEGGMLIFTINANRFLRNMVRAIVGTLVMVGQGKIRPHDFEDIIRGRDRRLAGPSAPAQGLFLWGIEYPDWI